MSRAPFSQKNTSRRADSTSSVRTEVHLDDWKPPALHSYDTIQLITNEEGEVLPVGFGHNGMSRRIKRDSLLA